MGAPHRRGGVSPHAPPAEVVAAADAAKSRTTPGLRRPHRVQDLLGLGLHPVGEAPLVLSQITGDTDEGKPEPAAVAVARVQVEEVGVVGQRLGLEPDRADVLPASEVILVPLAPGRDGGWQTLAAYLYRQLLVLDVGGGPADEPVSSRVEVRGYKVIQA